MMQSFNKSKIYFYAPNVFTGGGKILILSIINAINKTHSNESFFMILDERIKKNLNSNYNIQTFFCKKGILSRIYCEYKFSKITKINDIILIFNNVTFIFSTKAKCIMYVQHKLFTGKYLPNKYSDQIIHKIIYSIYFLINKIFSKKINNYFVQTQSMKNEILKNFYNKKVTVYPFLYDDINEKTYSKNIIYDFIYPANYYFHKNHLNLLKSFKILSLENIYPSLLLTVSYYDHKLLDLINYYKNKYRLKITILNEVRPDQIGKYYNKCNALIFPSKFESFGMPLIEANKFKLKILAPEFDYVRDVCDPDYTFDPNSPISISRSIKRYLKINETKMKIKKSIDFVNHLIDEL